MITYDPVDPTSEIIFDLGKVSYEKRNLVSPGASFVLGEWVGLGVNNTAVKVSSNGLEVIPRMVWTSSDRHDVAESEGITVARGHFDLSTMIYKVGESFAIGDELCILTDGGIGKLHKLPTGAGTYWCVGFVKVPPANDGTDRLIAEIVGQPVVKIVS